MHGIQVRLTSIKSLCFCVALAATSICGCFSNEVGSDSGLPEVTDDGSVCVYFDDFHVSDKFERVRVKGKEFKTDATLSSVISALIDLKPEVVCVAIGKNPHPDVDQRIRLLEKECAKLSIFVDTSADDLFFLLGGQLPE